MILAELSCRVPLVLEASSDRYQLLVHADGSARNSDFRQAGTVDTLAGEEGGPPPSATLLTIGVDKHHAFFCETVDVRSLVTHKPMAIATEVRNANVVPPNHEDVRLLCSFLHFFRHTLFLCWLDSTVKFDCG